MRTCVQRVLPQVSHDLRLVRNVVGLEFAVVRGYLNSLTTGRGGGNGGSDNDGDSTCIYH